QYLPALKLTGDPQRGERLYRKHCATCHKVSEEGFAVGPDWASVANRDPEALLISILDPNRETAPQYTNYVLTTDFGTTVTGMIAAETATSVTLRRAEGAEDTVLRRDIESLESTGASLMPEGLEKEVGLQDIADLLEYVARLTKK
ncbi:MAG: c-type cytochrome, partial [Planctomycetes bacterium]|nr:c-type cytochrome [Planctomycetota bacterium]